MFPLPSIPVFGHFANIGITPKQTSAVIPGVKENFHCITCMKGYNDISLEEIRWQDYQSGKIRLQPNSKLVNPPHGLSKTNFLKPQTNNAPFGQPTFFGQQTSEAFENSLGGYGLTSITNVPITRNNLFNSNSISIPLNQLVADSKQQNNTRPLKFGGKPFSNLFVKPKEEVHNPTQPTFQFSSQLPQKSANPNQRLSINSTGGVHNPNITASPEQLHQQSLVSFNNSSTTAPPKLNATQQPNPVTNLNSAFSVDISSNTKPTSSTNFIPNNSVPCAGCTSPSPSYQTSPTISFQTHTEAQFQQYNTLLLTNPFGYHQHLNGLTTVMDTVVVNNTNVEKLKKYLQIPERISVSRVRRKLKYKQITDKESCQTDDESPKCNFIPAKEDKKGSYKLISNEKGLINETYTLDTTDEQPLEVKFVCMRDSAFSKSDYSILKIEEQYCTASTYSENNINIINEPTSKDNRSANIDTCGILLTSSEYYTIPPLDKVAGYKQSNGECLVQGFTVGRIGYGSVSFPDLMDVANLNLDELVQFTYRKVVVYSDESKKPPLGQGLNRPAQVTLDNIYPRRKGDRKTITDIETLMCTNFSEQLRNICDNQGTRFLDYRPETGSWVFMVKHFSIYKYYDSSKYDIYDLPKDDRRNIVAEMNIM